MTQHKWHNEIKAWADGLQIEYFSEDYGWQYVEDGKTPTWDILTDYRISPEPKEKKYLYVYLTSEGYYELDTELRARSWVGKIKLEVLKDD